MESISEEVLLANREERKKNFSAARSQKAELQNWFLVRLAPRWGGKKPLDKRSFGVFTNYLCARDLFFMKSIYEDTERRYGGEDAAKEFWGSLKGRE